MCVCVSGCPRWQSTRCPLCEYRDPAWLSHIVLACQHALSHLPPRTLSYTLGRLAPFSLSRAVYQWPHCYSELLQMARAQIASASSIHHKRLLCRAPRQGPVCLPDPLPHLHVWDSGSCLLPYGHSKGGGTYCKSPQSRLGTKVWLRVINGPPSLFLSPRGIPP